MDYTKWNDEPTDLKVGDVIADYSEYSGESVDSIVEKINNFKQYTKEEFAKLGEDKFYHESNSYIYDILGANWVKHGPANKMHKFIPGIMEKIKDKNPKTFLEFGGGIGVFCQIIKEMVPDCRVIHMDIPGPLMDFARWRYTKYNLDIEVVEIGDKDFDLPVSTDVIFTDAVFEHLPQEQQNRYILKLIDGLSDDGLLICIIDLSGVNPDMPMHYNVNIFELHALAQSRATCLFGKNQFASVWQKGIND